jgi:soluble lytic murein transglycosylase
MFYPVKYEETVLEASATYGVEKELIYAIIKCESGFDEHAHSHAGAVGLMQIMPETFRWLQTCDSDLKLNEKDLENPETNIKCGTLLISMLRKKYGDEDIVLSSYNAGISVVRRWLNDKSVSADGVHLHNIPYKETKDYVSRVKIAKKFYKELYF